jgi:acyl-CoA synthetase (AMP-forming)/AMP-acid ligase II
MIYRSPHPEVAVPDVPLTPFVLQQVARWRDKPALIDGPTGRTLTYGELAQAIRSVARGLADRGFKKGDVFALYSPNLPEYAVAFHGVSLAGGVNTTANPLYTPGELATQLRDSGARFLLTVPQCLEKAFQAARDAAVEEVFVFGEAEGATPFAELCRGSGDPPELDLNPREDMVVLPYSSGTTGLPKGVMLTHRNLVANIVQTIGAFDSVTAVSEADTVMGVLPFFHIYGLVVILNIGLHLGATVVTLPRFDLPQFLEVCQRYQVTRAHLVPPIVLALAKHPLVSDFDLSHLKQIGSGAAPLGENVARACSERLGCTVVQGYGLTETSPVTHYCSGLPEKSKFGSVGPALPNTEWKIVDPASGAALGPGQDGEVWIRGPQVMKGYLNNPEATAETVDPEGWLRTGDIGHADEEGYLYVVDRVKELIKYKGLQVAPAELEAVLLSHPAIADAAVIPRPDEEAGEVPKAYVVARSKISAEEIMSFVAERVAPYKKVRGVEFIEEIPKSPAGKILRRVLIERERAK